jgi:peptidoglycan/xylan/chitin deacetylase (PgdA/CDA1 family)
MTWNEINDLSRRGFEIGNHTWTHTHVDHMDRARFDKELGNVERRMHASGMSAPTSFAYPAYVNTPAAVAMLREGGYQFARVGGGRAYDPAHDDPLLVPSFSTSGDNRAQILGAFEQARDGRIVVLTIHGVPDSAHAWVTTPPALFRGLSPLAARSPVHDRGAARSRALRRAAEGADHRYGAPLSLRLLQGKRRRRTAPRTQH